METQLQTNLSNIKLQLKYNLLPGNLKKDVTCLGVTGTLESGTDTSDATATASDMAQGKTAYANNEKITGNVKNYDTLTIWSDVSTSQLTKSDETGKIHLIYNSPENFMMKENSNIDCHIYYWQLAELIGLTADKIKSGETILGITGISPTIFTTIDEMNLHKDLPEDTLAIVYGTSYEGTYKLSDGEWTQLVVAQENNE